MERAEFEALSRRVEARASVTHLAHAVVAALFALMLGLAGWGSWEAQDKYRAWAPWAMMLAAAATLYGAVRLALSLRARSREAQDIALFLRAREELLKELEP